MTDAAVSRQEKPKRDCHHRSKHYADLKQTHRAVLVAAQSADHVDPYELLLPGGEGELTEELVASIKTADHPTQAFHSGYCAACAGVEERSAGI